MSGGAPVAIEDHASAGIYLRIYLQPLARFLEQPDVTEVMVNRPGEVWIERAGQMAM